MRLSRVSLVAVLAVLAALVLAGCPSETPEATPEETPSASVSSSSAPPPPPPPPPKVGACYDLTVATADDTSSGAEPVPCTKAHTARTVHVGRLAALGAGESVTDPRVGRRLATECPRRVDAFLGGDPVTRNLSRFVALWFLPSEAEAEAGAAWYRCDVVAFGRGDAFAELPQQRLEGVLAGDGALDTFGTCGTAAPGSRGFERVICSLPHSWRALTTIRIADGARYPGVARARSSGDTACADYAEGQAAGFTTEIDYGWEWPTEAQWEAGQRYGFCWAPA